MIAFIPYVFAAALPLTLILLSGLILGPLLPTAVIMRYRLKVVLLVAAAAVLPLLCIMVETTPVTGNQSSSGWRPSSPAMTVEAPAARGGSAAQPASVHGEVSRRPPTTSKGQAWTSKGQAWIPWFLTIYATGAMVVGLFFTLRIANTLLFLRRCTPVSGRLQIDLRKEAERCQVRNVICLESDEIRVPACAWVFFPMVLIPRNLNQRFSDDQMQCVLRHELLHLRRKDFIVAFVAGGLQVIYWFHPLIWLFVRGLANDRELSCDALVVRSNRSPQTYARTLLQLCQVGSESLGVNGNLSVVSLGSRIPVSRRIRMLSHYHHRLSRSKRISLVVGLAGLMAMSFLVQRQVASAANLPRLISGEASNHGASPTSGIEATQDSEISPPVVGYIEAVKSGRSDREMYEHFQQSMEYTGQTWNDDAWITNQESIVSSELASVDGNVIRAEAITINLPEGSQLQAQFYGKRVSMEQQSGASVITIEKGQLSVVDDQGVVRVMGRLAADAPDDALVMVTTTYARDEISMQLSAVDGNGNPVTVEAEFDAETGVAPDEEQPPHKAVRYELTEESVGQGPCKLKMQWIYQLGELRRSVGGN